jgi:hypothetical protein
VAHKIDGLTDHIVEVQPDVSWLALSRHVLDAGDDVDGELRAGHNALCELRDFGKVWIRLGELISGGSSRRWSGWPTAAA